MRLDAPESRFHKILSTKKNNDTNQTLKFRFELIDQFMIGGFILMKKKVRST